MPKPAKALKERLVQVRFSVDESALLDKLVVLYDENASVCVRRAVKLLAKSEGIK